MGVTLSMINWKRVGLWVWLTSPLYFLFLYREDPINYYKFDLSSIALSETNLESVPDLEIKVKYGL